MGQEDRGQPFVFVPALSHLLAYLLTCRSYPSAKIFYDYGFIRKMFPHFQVLQNLDLEIIFNINPLHIE